MDNTIVQLGRIRKIIARLDDKPDDMEIGAEFLLAALFPKMWDNVQEALMKEHTQGYIEGYKDAKNQ